MCNCEQTGILSTHNLVLLLVARERVARGWQIGPNALALNAEHFIVGTRPEAELSVPLNRSD